MRCAGRCELQALCVAHEVLVLLLLLLHEQQHLVTLVLLLLLLLLCHQLLLLLLLLVLQLLELQLVELLQGVDRHLRRYDCWQGGGRYSRCWRVGADRPGRLID